jgi:hypothetical protein
VTETKLCKRCSAEITKGTARLSPCGCAVILCGYCDFRPDTAWWMGQYAKFHKRIHEPTCAAMKGDE